MFECRILYCLLALLSLVLLLPPRYASHDAYTLLSGYKVKKNLIVRCALIQSALNAWYESTKEENVKNIFTTQGPDPPPHYAHFPGITNLSVLMSY